MQPQLFTPWALYNTYCVSMSSAQHTAAAQPGSSTLQLGYSQNIQGTGNISFVSREQHIVSDGAEHLNFVQPVCSVGFISPFLMLFFSPWLWLYTSEVTRCSKALLNSQSQCPLLQMQIATMCSFLILKSTSSSEQSPHLVSHTKTESNIYWHRANFSFVWTKHLITVPNMNKISHGISAL